jgi:very-short-patch-repair endonuclease
MFHSALEPEIEDDFVDETSDKIIGEFVETVCSKETFAAIGLVLPTVLNNMAIATSIVPDTESPIEVLFGAEAVKFFQGLYKDHRTMTFVRCHQADENTFAGDHTLLMPQYKWRNYRIDWVVKISFLKQPYFFIECDGRDFHSSEQQILRDRTKDEAIMNAGVQIFRFSGSELERNSLACVKIVHSATKAQYYRECAAGLHRQAG